MTVRLSYSQNNEDIVVRELFKRLDKKVEWVCEFGAWDGKHLSNTFTFIANDNANAVLIEGDSTKFIKLEKRANTHSNITAINKFIDNTNTLDSILAGTKITQNFDVLSIDIDSNDLDVWENLHSYDPICVVIEINNLIPPGIYKRHKDFTQEEIENKGDTWLNSFSSTIDVGLKKGYTPIKHVGWNLIFIKNEYANQLGLNTSNYENLFNFRWIRREDKRKAKEAKRQRKLKRGNNDKA
tara:strand:- start:4470 stop:5189 length:720 start_codon:yes stop_codon:yes gene_type:complete